MHGNSNIRCYVYKIYVGKSQQKHRCRLENNIKMNLSYLVRQPFLSVCQQCFRDRNVAVRSVFRSDRHGELPHSILSCSCLEHSVMGPAGWNKR